ncbi:hypothetical protein ACTPD5_21265, partial [Clostridioides difficile]|uniref:hypothetical protein n=1 Tax=Clostridioides difficile TaxID=1496 RepID=UPI003F8D79ED
FVSPLHTTKESELKLISGFSFAFISLLISTSNTYSIESSMLRPPWAFEGGVENMVKRLEVQENRDRIIKELEEGIPGWQCFYQL